MPTHRDKAIVLHRRTVRETDRHYTVFTESRGKVVLLAKGTRRSRSKMSPHMGSFGIVDIMIAKGKVIDRLAGASVERACRNIGRSLERSAAVQGVLHAVDAFTRREYPEPRIFALLADFLEAMDAEVPSVMAGTHRLMFDAAMLRLFDVLGFAPEIDVCVGCRNDLPEKGLAMNILRGGLECPRCRKPSSTPVSEETVRLMRLIRTEPFIALTLLRMQDETRRQVSFVTEVLITTHLEARFNPLRFIKAVI